MEETTREIDESIRAIEDFLGDERDGQSKATTSSIIRRELMKRPSVDSDKIRQRLESAVITTRSRYAFVGNLLMKDIRSGRYDGDEPKKEKAKGAKEPLSSRNLFRAFERLGVPKGDYAYERVDYYLNAVWMNSDITLEEIRSFTEGMLCWMEARHEWRTPENALRLCMMSKILGKHMGRDEAMRKVNEETAESKALDSEYEALLGGGTYEAG